MIRMHILVICTYVDRKIQLFALEIQYNRTSGISPTTRPNSAERSDFSYQQRVIAHCPSPAPKAQDSGLAHA